MVKIGWYLTEYYAGTFQAAIEIGIGEHWDIISSTHWYFLVPVLITDCNWKSRGKKNLHGKDTSFNKYQITTIKCCRE